MMLRRFFHVSLAFAALGVLIAPRVSAQTPLHPNNGVYLPDYNVVTSVPTVLATMQGYGVRYLFITNGGLQSGGGYSGAGYAVQWMNAIYSYEQSSGYQFKVLVAMPGDLTSSNSDYVDISNTTVQTNVAASCAKFTSSTVAGSYVASANRTFDGVALDLEPGSVYRSSTYFQQLGAKVRTSIGTAKLIAFYVPAYSSTQGDWNWNLTEYYYMTGYSHADFLLVGDYDSGCQTASAYQTFLQNQTYNVLRAVSGIAYNDPTGHPVPNTAVKVIFGFPAYGENSSNSTHNPAAENIPAAAQGVAAGLNSVDSTSYSFFLSADVFDQTNGTSSDGNATYATDWPNFNQYWLGNLPVIAAPTATTVSPNSAAAGASGTSITVTGANFVVGSVIQWNGIALPTTASNSTTLLATVPTADLATAGTAHITVFSPIRGVGGGGTSAALTFTITP